MDGTELELSQGTVNLSVFRFGTAEFDAAKFELRVEGNRVDVQPKPLEILAHLLTHTDRVFTKEKLLELVWKGRPTVENVLPNAITKLRHALGPKNASYIITKPRVGYRVAGMVEQTDAAPSLGNFYLRGGERIAGRDQFQLEVELGRIGDCEVWLAKNKLSREARIYKFAANTRQLDKLKREIMWSRLLCTSSAAHEHLAHIIDWNFTNAPFFIEYEDCRCTLVEWNNADWLAAN